MLLLICLALLLVKYLGSPSSERFSLFLSFLPATRWLQLLVRLRKLFVASFNTADAEAASEVALGFLKKINTPFNSKLF